ncbi:fused response regulator/phosphatase [Methylogaea oryzae]|uniref:Response regulatory domain-containing protein n=1 Tax=Methylogaea oryzae TaxID=1295382 RepID=A0A8D4VL77_9GAMM|nr:fused response regulator/phosphatase [Methylogaea oryzae]BBL69621.1 hypothetical protein MoryE10_02270 [Methylogaea oryzae]
MTLPSAPLPNDHRIVVLLIDDQRIIGEAVKRMLQDQADIEFHYSADALNAVETAVGLQPTLILQDLVMPEVDGLTLVKQFRAHPATAAVPMIVLSSKEEAQTKAEAFALGANDYLVKLPDRIELIARIRYHSAAYIAHRQRDAAYAALQRSQQALAAELAEAAAYVRSLLPPPVDAGGLRTAWEFFPCSSLGGDAFGYFDIDADHFAVFLLDVCNHGVGSALLSVSAMNALLGRALPGAEFRDPASVMGALNETFAMEKHNNLYFTLWYGVLHRPSRTLTYGSAGHPPAVLVAGGQTTLLRCRAMPIGAMPGMPFETASATVPPDARLYLYSDGIYEIHRPDGSLVTLEEFVAVLESGRPLPQVVEIMHALLPPEVDFDDDVALLEVAIA